MTFNPEQSVPSARRATSVTVINGSGGLLVGFRSTAGEVVTIRAATLASNGDLSGWTGETVQASYTDAEPELVLLPVNPAIYGSATVIALVYSNLGTYRWLSARYTNEAFSGRGALLRGDDVPMPGSLGVGLASWPHLNPTTACGAFADPDKKVGVYCWNREASRFVEAATGSDFLVGGAAPTTYGKPGFAFHQLRTSTGANVGDGLGQFWLSHTVYDARNKAVSPRVYISSPVSAANPPGSSMTFVHSAHVATYWAISPNTSAALYEDYALSALKGARLHIYPKADGTNTTRIDFLPLADGTIDAQLRDGNDFQVMERAICLGLRADDEFCGPANKFNY
jgi:hypothetical protein